MAKPSPTCSLCGAPVRPAFRLPRPEMAPDLDLRPGEPARSTLTHWVQNCYCGASAPDVTRLPAAAGEALQSAAYAALRAPGPAGPFLRWAHIATHLGQTADAAEATLQAAWALDDLGPARAADAASHRLEAVRLAGDAASLEAALRQIDILRRAGAFPRAEAAARALEGLDEGAAAIREFQLGRIAARDTGRHGFDSVLRPPSRRPHVSHGPAAGKPGFWRRIIGG